jgi:hypothetical protein
MKTQNKTQEIKKSLLKTISTEKGNESMESEDEISLDSDEEVFFIQSFTLLLKFITIYFWHQASTCICSKRIKTRLEHPSGATEKIRQ